MKEVQLLRNQRQHKYPKLKKIQVDGTVFIKAKENFKPRDVSHFTIIKELSKVLIPIKDAGNEIAQQFNINIDSVLELYCAHKRHQNLILQQRFFDFVQCRYVIALPSAWFHG